MKRNQPGKGDIFDRAIVKFAAAYADQTESDYRMMRTAVRHLDVAVIE